MYNCFFFAMASMILIGYWCIDGQGYAMVRLNISGKMVDDLNGVL